MIWSTILPFCCLSCCISIFSFYVNIFAFVVLVFWTFVLGTWYHHFLVCNLVSVCFPLIFFFFATWSIVLPCVLVTWYRHFCCLPLWISFVHFYVNTFAFMMLVFWTFILGTWYHHFLVSNLVFLLVAPFLKCFCNVVHSFAMCSCCLIWTLLLLATLYFICLFSCEYFCLYGACFMNTCTYHLTSPFPYLLSCLLSFFVKVFPTLSIVLPCAFVIWYYPFHLSFFVLEHSFCH